MIEKTLSIVKPDAVKKNAIGEILRRFEAAGLRVVAARMFQLSPDTAGRFYVVHKERPFYKDLVKFMSSGPILVSVLEGENAIAKYRDVMGATDPAKAAANTIRKVHAKSIGENSVHGSDSAENAAIEIGQFFSGNEIVG